MTSQLYNSNQHFHPPSLPQFVLPLDRYYEHSLIALHVSKGRIPCMLLAHQTLVGIRTTINDIAGQGIVVSTNHYYLICLVGT